ncbi:hypothetical protein PTKIN_Ptkin01aG0333400 [Pterospermum kingtungense]
MASAVTFRVWPCFGIKNSEFKPRFRVGAERLGGSDLSALSDGISVNETGFVIEEREKNGSFLDGLNSGVDKKLVCEELEELWDDGYGTNTVNDYLDAAKDMIKPDGGPPRWFCPVACGRPIKDYPLLLFLPGVDCVGMGLILHHKALGKVFEVRCFHIHVHDRIPFEATSFGTSKLQPSFPILEAFPDELLHVTIPYLPSLVMAEPLKISTVGVEGRLPLRQKIEQLSGNLSALLPRLSGLADIIPKETLIWKLKLLKSASAYANSRLHAIKAEVLLLASDKDNMLPTQDEAQCLTNLLPNCIIRRFKDNGHSLLLEADFLPPSMSEYSYAFEEAAGSMRFALCSAMFSTMEDGKLVETLAGVPDEGPVLLVGYHMLMGLDVYCLIEAFLREKKIMVCGIAHPAFLWGEFQSSFTEFSFVDWFRLMGALPVTANHMYKTLSANSHVCLYPGGPREALHYKGEQYKLFWPDEQEFVRMAARFGATIVPFGTVGEDDILELVLDYHDLIKILVVEDKIKETVRGGANTRDEAKGEVGSRKLSVPAMLPKIPGRFYYLFGKPIKLKDREGLMENKEDANEVYLQVKSEVKRCIGYLLKKREEDPYRNIIDRTIYRALYAPLEQVPESRVAGAS